ncbi:MAG TPA: sigma-54 dependent transcriptional regulator [Patescibacteria group bacterium]|nr:sigma-54 dependent transcriptional regulator [Patescibacteria group bacterium]
MDRVLLGLESGDSGVGLDLQYGGSGVHAHVRWLPKSDWLLMRLSPGGGGEEAVPETPGLLRRDEMLAAAAEQTTTIDAVLSGKASSETSDTVCEPLGDGMFFLASSPQMKKIRKQVIRVAPVNVPVLISGESGTGKEVIARMIHQHRTNRNGPFIKVNCAALPTELLESELFGYEQGAFTGAVRAKPGKFELANHGTIFLDEIAEISTHLQSKLLHVLQDGQFSRLGSRHMLQVDVRVIAATNVDVQEAIRQGRFREDLYYRLNVVPCHLPPLRERVAEIPLLFQLFLDRYCREFGKQVVLPSLALREAAERYSWPGNVRELENFVKRYVILADEQESLQEMLEMETSRGMEIQAHSNGNKPQTLKSLVRGLKDDAEMEAIADALKQTNWRRKDTARILGISYKALLYKMRQFGFTPASSNGHSHQETVI